jgi:hypothetical protein
MASSIHEQIFTCKVCSNTKQKTLECFAFLQNFERTQKVEDHYFKKPDTLIYLQDAFDSFLWHIIHDEIVLWCSLRSQT